MQNKMTNWHTVRNAGAALLGLLIAQAAGAAPAQCQYALLVSLPIKYDQLKPTIGATINGKPVTMLVDTGSTMSTIGRQSTEKLGLTAVPTSEHSYGVGGESRLGKVILNEVSLGPWTFHRQVVPVTEDFKLRQDMLLGANFLFQKDVEMSLQNQEIKLFKPEGCDGAFLAYWDENAQDVPLEKMPVGDPRAAVMVELNGKKLRAMIDSGAQRSAVNLAAAAKLGITPESDDVGQQGKVAGIGKQAVKRWAATFQSFTIGGETINHPQIAIFDMYGAAKSDSVKTGDVIFDDEEAEMVLGADFLRAHHVLFAFSQQRFYFSYVGGKVFDVSDGGKAPPAATSAESAAH